MFLLYILFTYLKAEDESFDIWARILEDEEIKNAYAACLEGRTDDTSRSACIKKVLDEQGKLDKYFEKIKPEAIPHLNINQAYDNNTDTKDDSKKPIINLSDMYLSTDQEGSVTTQNPLMTNLTELLIKRMDETLFGLDENGKRINENEIRIPQHSVFYSMLDQRIGKNILEVITNYCMQVPLNVEYLESQGTNTKNLSWNIAEGDEGKKEARESNMNCLQKYGPQKCYKYHWEDCMANISNKCLNITPDSDESKASSETQQLACSTMNYIEDQKKVLLINKGIQKKLKDTFEISLEDTTKLKGVSHEKTGTLLITAGTKLATDKNPRNLDDLMSITSKDVMDEEAIKELEKEMKALAEKCTTNPEDKDCSRYLSSIEDLNKKRDNLDELEARGILIGKSLENIENEDELRKYLEADGRSTDIIDEIKNGKVTFKEIKEQIAKKYKNEKEQTIRRLREDLNKLEDSAKTKTPKLPNPREELQTLSQLIHYHNIVTGFLSLHQEETSDSKSEAEDKEPKINTSSISKEMNAIQQGTEHLYPDSEGKENHLTELKKRLEESKTDYSSPEEGDRITVPIESINEMFVPISKDQRDKYLDKINSQKKK